MKVIFQLTVILTLQLPFMGIYAQPDKHIDPSPVKHKHTLSIAKHVSTAFTIEKARSSFAYGTKILQTCDNKVNDNQDVAVAVTVEPGATMGSFGTAGDGLDVINTQAELDIVMANNAYFVKVVTDMPGDGTGLCGAAGAILACASTPESTIAIVAGLTDEEMGEVLMHEFGHTRGLDHRDDPGKPIMHTSTLGNNEVNDTEAAAFHIGGTDDGPNRPVDVEFVVDDTGSMGEEIASVRNTILKILNLRKYTENPCAYVFQLVTFKDGISIRSSTTDLTVIRNQVSALVASGGGDCPEASVEAVEGIKNNVKDNGEVFIFTDAAPHAGTNIEALTAELQARGVSVSTLLSGDCTSTSLSLAKSADSVNQQDLIPFSDNHDSEAVESYSGKSGVESVSLLASLSPNPTAIEAFSFMAQETGGVFAFVPEINTGNPADIVRYENVAFNMIAGAISAAITNIEPSTGPVGGTLALTISGSRTNFDSSTTIAFSDPGILVKEIKVLSPTRLQATITIGTTVPLGFKDIRTSTAGSGGLIDTASGIGLLRVIAAPVAPTILSISPPSGNVGQNLTVKVTGINTHFNSTSVLTLGSGITVLTTTALSDVELEAEIQVASTATIGFRNVVVTTGAEVAAEAVPGPFLVTGVSSACDFSSLDLGPDKTVNLFYADSTCTTLAVSGLDSTSSTAYSFRWSTGDTTAIIKVCPTITTEYTVTVSSGTCTFTDTVSVIVNSCPVNLIVVAPSCSDKAMIRWTEPTDTYPASIQIPSSLDPGSGMLNYMGTFNGNGYYRSTNSYPWPVASDISRYIGGTGVNGHLVTITSGAENSFVLDHLKGSDYSPWIGLFNPGRAGNFRWVNSEALDYTNWQAGEPNNAGGNAGNVTEPYVQFYNTTGTWNDATNGSRPFVTEFERPLVRYRQISGPKNGSEHKVGVYMVCYERTNMITDYKDTCCFSVTVSCEGPFECPKDTVIIASSCTGNTEIRWTEPQGTFPTSIAIPTNLDPGGGTLSYIGTFEGNGYFKSDKSYSWPVASDITGYLGGTGVNGHLATLNSEAENNFIFNNIKGTGYQPWIGLFNPGRVGRFRWVTNEDVDYSNWQAGEPNNYGGDMRNVAEPYVHMYDNTGTWNDAANINHPFIAEFERPLIRYRQIAGPANGSAQKPGVYLICYERINLITDKKDTCCFSVTIQCSASKIEEPLIAEVKTTAKGTSTYESKVAIAGFKVLASPNPTSHSFTLKVESDNTRGRINLNVMDITGRIIEVKTGLSANQVVQFGSKYRPGVYLVQVMQGSRRLVMKLVKQAP